MSCAINASCAALAFAGIPMKHLAGKLSIFFSVIPLDFVANKSKAYICCSRD
jgi:ribonuclease PH